jgi:hypothetical protein
VSGWSVSAAGETIATHGATPGDVLTATGTTSVTYTPSGRTAVNPVNISLTSTETSTARCVSVSLSGQPTIKQEDCS